MLNLDQKIKCVMKPQVKLSARNFTVTVIIETKIIYESNGSRCTQISMFI